MADEVMTRGELLEQIPEMAEVFEGTEALQPLDRLIHGLPVPRARSLSASACLRLSDRWHAVRVAPRPEVR